MLIEGRVLNYYLLVAGMSIVKYQESISKLVAFNQRCCTKVKPKVVFITSIIHLRGSTMVWV